MMKEVERPRDTLLNLDLSTLGMYIVIVVIPFH